MTSTLYGLDVPDETAELDIRSANPKKVFKMLFENFEMTVPEEELCHSYMKINAAMYERACRMVKPFADVFGGTLRVTKTFLSTVDERIYLGGPKMAHFLSALLNETELERMTVNIRLPGIGYRLKEGKILELLEQAYVTEAGREAHGGIVINRGEVQNLGRPCFGGTFLIFKDVGVQVGGDQAYGESSDTLFLDFRKRSVSNRNLSSYSMTDCVFVSETQEIEGLYCNGHAGPAALKSDEALRSLMDEIKAASKASDAKTITSLGHQIYSHMFANYSGRWQ